jgi:L-ascorbate metabolism protein UlaG (beta-lactamase superfamily)
MFDYPGRRRTRRVLIDFGTTGLPKHRSRKSMLEIAEHIAQSCEGRLDAIVATHRHMDHISGFDGRSFAPIAACNPRVVLQPWTEDPKAAVDATGVTGSARRRALHVSMLGDMHRVAELALREFESGNPRRFSQTVRAQLAFLGEDNLSNAGAVSNLIDLDARHVYAHYGSSAGLDRVLPGVRVHVLGPPTIEQSDAIRRQRHEDPAEFWHMQARAGRTSRASAPVLFPSARSTVNAIPFEARWIVPRLNSIHGDELLEIVRILDKAMNNTSLILLFETGGKKLLFSGDAQIENWSYALRHAPDRSRVRRLLADVHFYKVGHHGSLNATPKSLWGLFDHRGEAGSPERLRTVMSTMKGKHGSTRRNTEVPRRTLVEALEAESDHFSTESLKRDRFYEDAVIKI